MTTKKVHTQPKKKHKKKINKKNLFTIIIACIAASCVVIGSIGLIVMANMLQGKPELIVDNFISPESSRIYDANGELIADVGNQIRTNITYDELPESLVDAFVSIEDSRFFGHNGFDVARFAKSGIEVLKAGAFVQGGSTLTMQLVKNTYFVNDETGSGAPKKIERKVQEIALAMELETKINKKTILELYLNKINFGGTGGIRGVQKASQYYFGKDVGALNTAESAMLAGIVNAPSLFNPHQHLDYATNRRNTVLSMMKYHGYISASEYDLYSSILVEDLLVDPSKQEANGEDEYAYQSYIDYVVKEAQEVTGLDPYAVSMEIYTAMDKDAQEMMDSIQAGEQESVNFPDDLMEIGMFSMNNQTGEVVAIGGGRNYGRGGSMLLNHATDQYKQPGSSIKTVLSYPLAFEHLGWSTSHVVVDQPIIYAGTDFVIRNANGQYVGQITLKEAVEKSLNTPAITTLQEVVNKAGMNTVTAYLQSLGFSSVKNNPELVDIQYAIGGSNFIVSCEELAAAHSVMMNGGYYIQPHAITKIEFNNGNEPYVANYAKNQVISTSTAFMISDLMRYAVEGPSFNYMEVLKRSYPVYGKTGTTDWGTEGLQYNIPQGAIKDKWMVSETSMYTTAVWVGYEKGVKDAGTYFNSAKSQMNIPGNISSLILSSLTDDQNPAAVAQPDDVTSITHILATFPYAAPIENMDPAYLTTGYIQKDNAKLASPETTEIAELGSFNANLAQDGTLNINWAPYPDASKLTVAPDTMDLSLSVGNTYVEAWGKRLFDYTWIYGPIRYKARIMQDGQQVQEIISETENFSGQVALNPGSHIQVCGYYAFESMPMTSNEICSEFEMVDAEVKITIPSADAKLVDLTNWAGPNNYRYETKQVIDNSKAGKTEVQFNGQNVSGQTISVKQSELANISFVFIEYIAEVPEPTTPPTPTNPPAPTCGANASLVDGACKCNDGYEGDPIKGCTAKDSGNSGETEKPETDD
ncbi:MAG: penicillin-binding protein [Erysipelotrichaceae bacterium]|nr:penicillin-binding protein [Erysipelotrichaceae bacterium]MDY5252483.1 transglycosylase domain-containing protein [Erysipelotrichaceae bacterium]